MNIQDRLYRTSIILLTVVFFIFIINSCRHDLEDISMYPEICFEKEVLPIFQTSCGISGCHSSSGGENEYIYTSYATIMESIVPGDPLNSEAYEAIITMFGEEAMPPSQPLPEQNRTIIRLWIEQGAENTQCPDPVDSTAVNPEVCFDRDILPVLQSSCAIAGCHDPGTAEGDLVFNNYANTMEAVVAGSPSLSNLYEKITKEEEGDRMPPPPYDRLQGYQIDSIYSWILKGAKNEFCGEVCDTISAVTYSAMVWPVIERNCYGCHNGASASNGQHLENYNDIAIAAENGKLMGVLKSLSGFVSMPPSGPLPECNINQIQEWVDIGYPNN